MGPSSSSFLSIAPSAACEHLDLYWGERVKAPEKQDRRRQGSVDTHHEAQAYGKETGENGNTDTEKLVF